MMPSPLDIPYNRLLGMTSAADGSFVFELPDGESIRNHLGTIHAAAQFSLAEATSASILLAALGDLHPEPFAVVRRFEGKFREALRGRVRSRGTIPADTVAALRRTLSERGRAAVAVSVEILDDTGAIGLQTSIEWFIQVRPGARVPHE